MQRYVTPVVIVVVVVFVAVVGIVDRLIYFNPAPPISYGEFRRAVDADRVAEVTISPREITGVYKGNGANNRFTTAAPNDPTLVPDLLRHNVRVDQQNSSQAPWFAVIFNAVPFLLMAILLVFLLRQTQRRLALQPSPLIAGAAAARAQQIIGGYVNADGSIAGGSGFTVSRDAPGKFTISAIAPPVTGAFPVLTATPWGADGPAAFITVEPSGASTNGAAFVIRVRDAAGQPLDAAFTFTIVQA